MGGSYTRFRLMVRHRAIAGSSRENLRIRRFALKTLRRRHFGFEVDAQAVGHALRSLRLADRSVHSAFELGPAAQQVLGYAEISRLLQIPEGTAMSHVHRTRQFLRQKLSTATNDQGGKGIAG